MMVLCPINACSESCEQQSFLRISGKGENMEIKLSPHTFGRLAVLVMLLISVNACAAASGGNRVPQFAGQDVPNTAFTIDFSKRYNIVCSTSQQNLRYDNVRVLGYTGGQEDFIKGHGNFQRWLVIERSDGRKAYLSPHSIIVVEEVEVSRR
jgi:hypothetical protein